MSRRVRFLACVALAPAVLGGCATVHPYYDYAHEPDPRRQEFVLGPADVLRINVWKNPDLSGDATIRPDGTIALPLLGEIRAAGRSPRELQGELAQKLSAFVKDESATVTVTVSTINSYRFVVLGNVEHGGSFTANHYTTVTEAIALAGGPNRFADAEQMVIIRLDAQKGVKRIPIDYLAILSGSRPDENLALMAGDTLYVP